MKYRISWYFTKYFDTYFR